MKALLGTALAFVAVLTPSIASAAASVGFGLSISFGTGNACGTTICAVASQILYLINYVLVPLIFAISFLVFLYGVARAYIISRGDEEAVKEGHRLILWGIIGFVVMVSLWGLVNIVSNTFGLSGFGAPPTPTSYPSAYY